MGKKSKIRAAEQPAFAAALPFNQTITAPSFNLSAEAGLNAWIYWHYRYKAFNADGTFKGLPWLRKHLFSFATGLSTTKIRQALNSLLQSDHQYSLAHTKKISKQIRGGNMKTPSTDLFTLPALYTQGGVDINATRSVSSISEPFHATPSKGTDDPPRPANGGINLLSFKMGQTHILDNLTDIVKEPANEGNSRERSSDSPSGDLGDLDFLLPDASEGEDNRSGQVNGAVSRIQQAPLIDASIISGARADLLAQYGLLGAHSDATDTKSKLLLNTNVPFSMFLCGVQGSGKSHTTSCILENSLIPSRHLGKLRNPLSALVFSYSKFSGEGEGFLVSEAAFLASPDSRLPGEAHVKKVHVLVSPSNFARISKLYLRLPNVLVTQFKLKPQDLDIDTMLTLMNVSESNETPLYMAQVTQILRDMSTAGGPFSYQAFKMHLKKKKFNPAQTSMLQMRLDLLESFLDLKGDIVEPHFQPGEITIMDMSCPFVDANTACILFKIGLKGYLQSKTSGKMIVLDEAHKYMLNVPGAKALNETLLQTVRLQRHYGARVIISTQEPTLLTDLIALCSITVIHRFSSPEWLSAIKRHIPTAAENCGDLMSRIEGLTTGKALLYSPNAVLGHDDSGNLITGTSKFISVSIRRRITSDGGQSVLAG